MPKTPAGITALTGALRALPPARVVLEATGGYERAVARALAGAGLPVVVVNPRSVRHFACALGILAKTDALDAGVLAHKRGDAEARASRHALRRGAGDGRSDGAARG